MPQSRTLLTRQLPRATNPADAETVSAVVGRMYLPVHARASKTLSKVPRAVINGAQYHFTESGVP
jgi:hypothetical protein